MMLLKALVLLAAGCLAQNARVSIDSNCSIALEGTDPYDWCATAGDITIYWQKLGEVARIAVSTTNTGAKWCAWGISDTPNMLSSSVIIWGADVDDEDQTTWDLVIGEQRARPAAAPAGQLQGRGTEFHLTANAEVADAGLIGTIQRNVEVAGLAETRQLAGVVNMIAACGTQETLMKHDITPFWVTLNFDTAECEGCAVTVPPGMTTSASNTTSAPGGTPAPNEPGSGSGASSLQIASAALVVAASVAVASLQ